MHSLQRFTRTQPPELKTFPLEGPTIFASNHSSFYDPPVIGVKVSRQIHYLARDTLFKGFFWSLPPPNWYHSGELEARRMFNQ